LAEDSPVSQTVAAAMLANLGFHVDVVSDGADAVDFATRTPYQAILMDCQLPVLNGYEATNEIRRREAGSRRTPIIAVTASALNSDRERCLSAGMDDYLAKPFNLKVLAVVLARWTTDRADLIAPVEATEAVPTTALNLTDADSTRPVLDPEVVDRLERLGQAAGENLLEQLSILFLTDADARVIALREALADHDAGAVVRSAHLLSGASANVGATDLARLCAMFATDGAAGELKAGGAQLDAVEAELERVRVALGTPAPTL
jgi:CheY-like chemotaxis protein/HPt (histidine-containing phosphotransfer) domain-containing protein